MIEVIAFDADDTLWHNEDLYVLTQEQFADLLTPFADLETVRKALYETESRNLAYFGYGIKSFTLSMVETAVELTEGRVDGATIGRIVNFGKEMREYPVQLFDPVPAVLEALEDQYRLMLVTKGDLFEQESKVARSGIAERFDYVEIVSEKDQATYQRLLDRHGIRPASFMMVGNSVRSDVLPVVELGGFAVHVPYRITWEHERVKDVGPEHNGYYELENLEELPGLLQELTKGKLSAVQEL